MPSGDFGEMLRRLRREARLTQEDLAETAGISARSVSDLERGINATARNDTARRLADALNLTRERREEFEAAAFGQAPTAAMVRTLPREPVSFTGRDEELQQLVDAAGGARGVVEIHAIGGMAGVGKTALAVHAAYRVAELFPGAFLRAAARDTRGCARHFVAGIRSSGRRNSVGHDRAHDDVAGPHRRKEAFANLG